MGEIADKILGRKSAKELTYEREYEKTREKYERMMAREKKEEEKDKKILERIEKSKPENIKKRARERYYNRMTRSRLEREGRKEASKQLDRERPLSEKAREVLARRLKTKDRRAYYRMYNKTRRKKSYRYNPYYHTESQERGYKRAKATSMFFGGKPDRAVPVNPALPSSVRRTSNSFSNPAMPFSREEAKKQWRKWI